MGQQKGNKEDLILYIDDRKDLSWDIETDVLVIGAGACGLVAALAAAEKGVRVLVLEKEKAAAGNTALSQGMINAAGTRLQKEAGIDDSPEILAEDILKYNGYKGDREETLHLARESGKMVDWLMDRIGIPLQLMTDALYPGLSRHRVHTNPTRKGTHLITDLLQAVARQGNIDIAYNAPAKRLVANRRDGAVVGAEVEIKGVGRNLARAKKVILALNGFGGNREMVRKYMPEIADALYFGHEGNTGEGISWGEALGAELKYMGAYQAHGSVATPHGTLVTWIVIALGGYQVNLDGRRFVNEYHSYSGHALDVLKQKEGVAVEIFDQRILDGVTAYEDVQKCIEMGAVKKFGSIEELAVGFRLPADELARTLEAFQRSVKGELLDPFGRTVFGHPLEPPLCGVRVTGALFHTQGGLKVNYIAQVIRTDGTPIPNLYAGGGTAAGYSGPDGPYGYGSGNGLLSACVLGKIAGEEAGRSALQGI